MTVLDAEPATAVPGARPGKADADDCPATLVRVDPSEPGLTRRRRGRGWSYLDTTGAPITDPAELARLKALVVPPAWRDVWISPNPCGHIQAIGTDAAGRRQYRYHEDWRRARDITKYDRVLSLGARLERVRPEVVRRLGEDGMSRERVLAAAFRLLDIGVFRAGGEEYAPGDDDEDESGTFGLATLRREHVTLRRDGVVVFSYVGKHHIHRTVALRDPRVLPVIATLRRRRSGGDELLAYTDDAGKWVDVKTADLNAAVKELAGEQYSCKDLRTWNGTVLAAVTLAGLVSEDGMPTTARARKRVVTTTIKAVAAHLGNTPAVARSSYIDPRVLERFEGGRTVAAALRRADTDDDGRPMDDDARATLERAVVRLIRGQ
jgi:DNA topoisomerase IB